MVDVREQILARCRALIETVPGLATSGATVRGVGRNREDVSGKSRPAIIMHDGNEEFVESTNPPRRSGVQMMKLLPQFVILVGTQTEQVGSVANGFRASLLSILLNDDELLTLVGGARGNGDIRYEGCEFESQYGETREGRMSLNLAFTYALKVTDLAA